MNKATNLHMQIFFIGYQPDEHTSDPTSSRLLVRCQVQSSEAPPRYWVQYRGRGGCFGPLGPTLEMGEGSGILSAMVGCQSP